MAGFLAGGGAIEESEGVDGVEGVDEVDATPELLPRCKLECMSHQSFTSFIRQTRITHIPLCDAQKV